MVDICEVPRDDEALLRAWYDTMRAAWTDDRPDAVYLPYAAQRQAYLDPPPHGYRVFLAARDGDRVVGGADLTLETEVNLSRAEFEIAVVADRRREGIGTALFDEVDRRCRADGRTTYGFELYCAADADPTQTPGYQFCASRGYAEASREHHLVLDVPMDDARLGELRASCRSDAYEIVSWTNVCPDELAEAFCLLREQMVTDVPTGDVVFEHRAWTVERLREGETRMARNWVTVTAAARHVPTGRLAGYSELLIPKTQPAMLWQDDTLVMPEHRGHRLGLALKLATYDVLRRDHPERRHVHTWTEVDNTAMLRTNDAFGYRRAELMLEMQRLPHPTG